MLKLIVTSTLLIGLFWGTKLGIKWWSVWQADSYKAMLQSLYSHSIPTIESGQFNTAEVHLLDTRSREEFEVSHIEGAVFFDYSNPPFHLLESIDKIDTVIVYCSVGYRSEKIGEKLRTLGYPNVYNLYGGIFAWANLNRRLVNPKNQPTQRVHSYKKAWSKWLDSNIKAVY